MGTKVVYVWQLKDRIGGYTKVAHSFCSVESSLQKSLQRATS